jgi:hypothetical protein
MSPAGVWLSAPQIDGRPAPTRNCNEITTAVEVWLYAGKRTENRQVDAADCEAYCQQCGAPANVFGAIFHYPECDWDTEDIRFRRRSASDLGLRGPLGLAWARAVRN